MHRSSALEKIQQMDPVLTSAALWIGPAELFGAKAAPWFEPGRL